MAFQQFPQKGGIPSGNTATRPSSPAIGDTFYNGQLGILEIWTDAGAWFPCSAPPATPTNVVATDTSSADAYSVSGGKLSVSFTAGSGGGQPTNYIVYTTAGGFSTSGASSPLLLTGLTVGEAYTVYAVAQNGFGNSAASANAAAVTPTTVAQAPTIGTATDASIGNTLYLTFTAGASGGKTITNYKYELNSSGTFTAFSPAQTSSPLTISGLTNDTAYTVKLKAVTANGDSPASSASNSATPTNTVTVDFLVVAGGGSGASKNSSVACGGGGAGGMKSSVSNTGGSIGTLKTALVLSKGVAYTCSVGGGGAAYTPPDTTENGVRANAGTDSYISGTGITTMTATGGSGGHGGQGNVNAPVGGGSGGGAGAGDFAATGGAGNSDEGYKGGDSTGSGSNPSRGAGGGGGASAAGANAGAGVATAGGAGQSNSITGSSITYAGGGGAATYLTASAGGAGGGGDGSTSAAGTAGTANLGGGGGAYCNNATARASGAGGSGVVIIRSLVAAVSTTGSPTATTSGSYYIYKFTGTGSITY
jgi:hypothetical protein